MTTIEVLCSRKAQDRFLKSLPVVTLRLKDRRSGSFYLWLYIIPPFSAWQCWLDDMKDIRPAKSLYLLSTKVFFQNKRRSKTEEETVWSRFTLKMAVKTEVDGLAVQSTRLNTEGCGTCGWLDDLPSSRLVWTRQLTGHQRSRSIATNYNY